MPLDPVEEKRRRDRNPEGYEPQDKEAPIPATDIDPEIAENVRTPKRATVKEKAREVAGKVVERVKAVSMPDNKRLSPNDRVRRVAENDARKMRAVKRFRGTVRDTVLGPAIRIAFRSAGVSGVPAKDIDAVIAELCDGKHFAGYKVTKRGDIVSRELPIDALVAYTIGSKGLGVEDWVIDASINHPNLFDMVTLLLAIGDIAVKLSESDAVKRAVDSYVERQNGSPPESSAGVEVRPAE